MIINVQLIWGHATILTAMKIVALGNAGITIVDFTHVHYVRIGDLSISINFVFVIMIVIMDRGHIYVDSEFEVYWFLQ